jgi:hypothetical protein
MENAAHSSVKFCQLKAEYLSGFLRGDDYLFRGIDVAIPSLGGQLSRQH